MTRTLITGANQGLGYHAAQRLMAVGHELWVSARDPKSGTEAARTLGARFVHLDVTDDASVAAARMQGAWTSSSIMLGYQIGHR